ncbi:MAG: response regulator [Thermodesulfobacteriota bacterium]
MNTVLKAASPGEACLIAEKHGNPIQLLLTDVVMPVMNGRELKERIEALHPGIRTIFMSGYTADVIAQRGQLAEGTAFVQKPFSRESLAAKVREVLDAGGAPPDC